MKKIILYLLLFSFSSNLSSQTKKQALKTLNQIENSKSGNLIDVFAGFYQFAFKSIDVNEKSLDLNSTLFSLVKNYDEDILNTKNRSSIVFLRNFQINAKLNLDDKLNFNGYSVGFTYALLNKRDKGFIDLDENLKEQINELDLLMVNATTKIITAEMDSYRTKNNKEMSSSEMNKLSDDISEVSTSIRNGENVENPKLQQYYDDVKKELNKEIINNNYFQNLKNKNNNNLVNIDSVNTHLQDLKDDYIKDLEKKPFLSISPSAITDKDGKLNQASAEMVFLVGNRFGEFDVRAKYNYLDTISPSMPRSIFNGKIGYNFKVLTKGVKSFFEIKAYGEYNKIFKNVLTNEKEETILANADFRIRLTDDVWIPITVKYDTETSNFLGFLNVTYSFGI